MTIPTGNLETAIAAAGAAAAPRITLADIEANILSEVYLNPHGVTLDAVRFKFLTDDHDDVDVRRKLRDLHERLPAMSTSAVRESLDRLMGVPSQATDPLSLLTFCVLVLRNGFTVTGESACASPENFNAEIGRRIARENAVAKVWPLMGYELKTALAKADTGAEIR